MTRQVWSIVVVFVVRLIDETRFWWWLTRILFGGGGSSDGEDRAATYGFSHLFFFFARGFRPISAGAESSFPSRRIPKVGTAAAAVAVFFFCFFVLLVAVIMYLSFFSFIFPIVVCWSFRARRFNASPNPVPPSLPRPARRAHTTAALRTSLSRSCRRAAAAAVTTRRCKKKRNNNFVAA